MFGGPKQVASRGGCFLLKISQPPTPKSTKRSLCRWTLPLTMLLAQGGRMSCLGICARKRKAYATTTHQKIFWKLDTPNMTGRRFHRAMDIIPPAPGSLKGLLFPPLLNKVQNKGMQGVQARSCAELPPFISIVRHPGRPVILGMEKLCWPPEKHSRPVASFKNQAK